MRPRSPASLALLAVLSCGPVDADDDGWPADTDCDDTNPAVHPGAVEICGNDVDDDCDGRPGRCRWHGGLDVESLKGARYTSDEFEFGWDVALWTADQLVIATQPEGAYRFPTAAGTYRTDGTPEVPGRLQEVEAAGGALYLEDESFSVERYDDSATGPADRWVFDGGVMHLTAVDRGAAVVVAWTDADAQQLHWLDAGEEPRTLAEAPAGSYIEQVTVGPGEPGARIAYVLYDPPTSDGWGVRVVGEWESGVNLAEREPIWPASGIRDGGGWLVGVYDFDGDGNTELGIEKRGLFTVDKDGREVCARTDGDGRVTLGVHDLDGDGVADVLSTDGERESIVVEYGPCTRWGVVDARLWTATRQAAAYAVDDVDGDGYADLVISEVSRGMVTLVHSNAW